jgi:pyridoxine kinase
MYANKVKKIAAVHDLSGMGRVSLTVVIPILSSMGFQVCPLPTAVLSNHTQYPGFSFLDLTDEMPKIIAEWKKLEVQFDAIIPVIWVPRGRFRLFPISSRISVSRIV